MGLGDGCTAFPWDLLQNSSSSHASRGEGAGTWVKPMFPMAPHSSSLDTNNIHAGNREWWGWGTNLLLENLWAPSGWFLKASAASQKREKQTDRIGAGSTSSVELYPWRCLLVGSQEGNGNEIPGMASAVLAEEWLVRPCPGNNCSNVFSCCFICSSKGQGRCSGHLVVVVV